MLGYNQYVKSPAGNELAVIERRCRTATGLVLACVAFAASYVLMLVQGRTGSELLSLYPWFLAAIFYVAGDTLAFIWVKAIAWHIQKMVIQQLDDASRKLDQSSSPELDEQEEQVEVIRPTEAED